MRQLALLLSLCACTTISNDDQDQLEIYQRNAPIYFDGGKLEQAMIQVQRGLEIDPDDYKLNAIKGAVLLRSTEQNPSLLDRATTLLARIYKWRSPMRHEPYVLLYYALAEQKQGLRNLGEAIRLEDRARRAATPELAESTAVLAQDQRTLAAQRLNHADELLVYLIDQGELLRIVHKHRLQIARQQNNDGRFKLSVDAFLVESEKDQARLRAEVERTMTPAWEADQYKQLAALRREELEVRALFADWHFHRREYTEALAQLDRVIAIDPKRTNDYYNRGRVLVALEREEDAKQDFRRFLATSRLPSASAKITYATKALQR